MVVELAHLGSFRWRGVVIHLVYVQAEVVQLLSWVYQGVGSYDDSSWTCKVCADLGKFPSPTLWLFHSGVSVTGRTMGM